MTLVELFDKNPVENIISSLCCSLSALYLGAKEIMAGHKRIIEKLLMKEGLNRYSLLHPDRNFDCCGFCEIQKIPDCEFDLTGGDDLMSAGSIEKSTVESTDTLSATGALWALI